jgi:hypothetical protein
MVMFLKLFFERIPTGLDVCMIFGCLDTGSFLQMKTYSTKI